MTPEQRADRVGIAMGEMADGVEYVKDAETRANIAAAIREAVAAERERCAVIAEIAATHSLGEPCRIIARRIRIDPAKGE